MSTSGGVYKHQRALTAQRIADVFRASAEPLSIYAVARKLGLSTERVRRHVKEPEYHMVDCEWATRRWQWRWALSRIACDCGAVAWYSGTATVLSRDGKPYQFTMNLCHQCAEFADAGVIVNKLYGP